MQPLVQNFVEQQGIIAVIYFLRIPRIEKGFKDGELGVLLEQMIQKYAPTT